MRSPWGKCCSFRSRVIHRIRRALPLLLWLLASAAPSFAQEDATQRALAAAERAERAVSQAFDLLSLFEAIGFLATVLGISAAIFGFTRLIRATAILDRTRADILREQQSAAAQMQLNLQTRQDELNELRAELRLQAEQTRAAAHNSALALALLHLGERQYRAQDYAGAIDTYRRAIAFDDSVPVPHYRLGYVLVNQGDLPAALDSLERALSIDPEFAPAQAALGLAFRRQAERMSPSPERDLLLNRAEEQLLRALTAVPKLVDDDGESWWGPLGSLYRQRGQLEAARQSYERAARVTPHSSYPFSNLALLYLQEGKREPMLETYRRVEELAHAEVRAQVDNYWAYADLVASRLALGKSAEAESVLQMALEVSPDDSPYPLQSLRDTLSLLRKRLPEQAASIERIRTLIEDFQNHRRATHQVNASA